MQGEAELVVQLQGRTGAGLGHDRKWSEEAGRNVIAQTAGAQMHRSRGYYPPRRSCETSFSGTASSEMKSGAYKLQSSF